MVEYEPERDASLGLIFRLNNLWDRADRIALTGRYDEWELILDRIFSNLLYREDLKIEKGKVEFSEDAVGVWDKIKNDIKRAKINKLLALKRKDGIRFINAKEEHYLKLILYDVWLRKYMQFLGLYLKETEKSPGGALFGGAFKGRRPM